MECKLQDDLPPLESTDKEFKYADAEESEYHTPPVAKSPTLQLTEPESLVSTPRENDVLLPICVSHSELVNPSQGQHAVCSTGPICLPPTIFHLQHPYKPLGSLGPRWEPSLTQLAKWKYWRQWVCVSGIHYASVLMGHAPSEGSSTSDRSE